MSHGVRCLSGVAKLSGRTDGCLSPHLSAKACKKAKQRVGVYYSRVPRCGATRQGVVLTYFQSFVDCQ